MSTSTHTAAEVDAAAVEAFAGRMLGVLNDAAVAVLTSTGHQTGLFGTMAALPAATSEQIADAAGLDERYVREWLGGMTTARIVRYDPATATYALPGEHAAVLTPAAGANNVAILMQHVAMMGEVEQRVIERFRHGVASPTPTTPTSTATWPRRVPRYTTPPSSRAFCPSSRGFPMRCGRVSTWPTSAAAAAMPSTSWRRRSRRAVSPATTSR
ncbi:hypothetical protein [Cellulomonas sp. ATA003]|uniref:hypothetical protein n=1 Tax=Cellulomonas sp. ATA003 TaxID=3073064 RepID=UPI0028737345|nr:hypothetical protein [Cellulomonas sp. ATA003]WNB87066.1 hypothetical protein REH70_08050 [Cellulomonas sp. ATA003]